MKRVIPVFILSILLLTTVFASGCIPTDDIGDILAEPEQYEGKEVRIKGTVGDTIWLISEGAYQVGDGTGTIWVTTKEPPPQQGTTVTVKGSVEPAVTIGDTSLGTVVVESERK